MSPILVGFFNTQKRRPGVKNTYATDLFDCSLHGMALAFRLGVESHWRLELRDETVKQLVTITMERKMKKLLKYLSALAFAVVMAPAHAINVGGVVWDPNSIFDFSATDTMIESQVNAVGDTLNGYAKIVNINGETNQNVFCPGCEVTYVFSGYTLDKITAGGDFVFTGGTITVYVDDTPDYNSLLQSTAADGAIWLVLDGALHVDGSTGELGTLHSDPTPTATGVEGDGRGFLHVTGGLAAANFDTNTFPIIIDLLGTEGFADFLFTSSFQLIPGGCFTSDDDRVYCIFGSNEIQGSSVVVPEPSTLLLMGLALLGLGAVRRRLA